MNATQYARQTSAIKNVVYLNERLKTKVPRKRAPPGVAREVLQLGGATLTSLPVHTRFPSDDTSQINPLRSKWVWCHFKNSAHQGRVHLHHWAPLADVVPRQPSESQVLVSAADSNLLGDTGEKKHEQESARGSEKSCSHASDPSKAPIKDAGVKESSESQQYACCEYVSKFDAPAAQFNKKSQVVRYTPNLYQKLVQNLDPSWSSWETDYLFDLCVEFDLRFVVIHDRYAPVKVLQEALAKVSSLSSSEPDRVSSCATADARSSSALMSVSAPLLPFAKNGLYSASTQSLYSQTPEQLQLLLERVQAAAPRPLEQLKERYYSVARRLVDHDFNKKIQSIERRFAQLTNTVSAENVDMLTQQKTQLLNETRAEMARHPLLRFPYDIAADKQRREYLDRQYRMSEAERREEQALVQHVVRSEMNAKRNTRKEVQQVGQSKKRKKSGMLFPASSGSRGTNSSANTNLFEQIPIAFFQNYLASQRKPGAILASQVMQQFAAPILLQAAAGSSATVGRSTNVSSAGGGTTATTTATEANAAAAQNFGAVPTANSAAMKKHEERIEIELKALGFGTTGSPLWPTYCDKEIIEAFNALRIDVVTMINWNTQIEQLEKERASWKARLSQLKEEDAPHNGIHGTTNGVTLSIPGHESNNRLTGNAAADKKALARVTPSSDKVVKKPRKPTPKRPSVPVKDT